jgi:hypothetical protein
MRHEFVVPGIPVSLQSKNAARRAAWKERVAQVARTAVEEADRVEFEDLSVLIVHFCFDWDDGDLDNIAKPILDGLVGPVMFDDRQVTQLTLRRTELGKETVEVIAPSPCLTEALQAAYPFRDDFVYLRIDPAPDHARLP